MKIEIHNSDPSGCFGYKVYDLNNNKLIHNHNNSQITNMDHYFDEEEINNLIGDKQFKQFENGKYIFAVTKKQIFAVSNNLNYFTMPK